MGTIRLVCPTPSEATRGTSFINSLMHFLSPFDRDWLVGLLEADGSFSCTRSPHTSKIQLAIKLTQHPSNIRALVAVKKLLRTGKIEHISSANTRFCGAQRDKRSTYNQSIQHKKTYLFLQQNAYILYAHQYAIAYNQLMQHSTTARSFSYTKIHVFLQEHLSLSTQKYIHFVYSTTHRGL